MTPDIQTRNGVDARAWGYTRNFLVFVNTTTIAYRTTGILRLWPIFCSYAIPHYLGTLTCGESTSSHWTGVAKLSEYQKHT